MMNWTEIKKQSLALLVDRFGEREAVAMIRVLSEDLLIGGALPMQEQDLQQWFQALDRLLLDEPIAYITGISYFLHLKLQVGPGVLIPRPESEELASLVIDYIREHKPHTKLDVLDIGTGSGCLALAIKSKCPQAEVTAIDLSTTALHTAQDNAQRLELTITFQQVDILSKDTWSNLPARLDIIISNPPYIQNNERDLMSPTTLKYEPEIALFAEGDPLKFYKAIAQLGSQRLNAGGFVFVEINEFLSQKTVSVFLDAGFHPVTLMKDINGRDRMISAAWIL